MRSVLSPGVVVEEGAVVVDSVLLHDVAVRAGARVERAIVDTGVQVAPGTETAGGAADGEIAVLGPGAGGGARAGGDRSP